VAIVGAGALGSHAALFLRNDARIKVIDFDRIEWKNVLSQFHTKPSVGKNKAEALKQSMSFLFDVKVEAIPHALSTTNAEQLLGGADVIIDCLDNAAARLVVQAYARAHGIACLHGALAPAGEFGRVVWDEAFTIDSESSAGAPTCEGGEFLPFVAIVASHLARAAQIFLKGGNKVGFQIHPAGVVII
jgi:predicted ThiF/HesA family dinucleotide-utilizing enzyme